MLSNKFKFKIIISLFLVLFFSILGFVINIKRTTKITAQEIVPPADPGLNTDYTKVTVNYTIDNDPPTVSIEGAPADWQDSDAQASVSCSDTESGCDSATYRIITYSSDPGACPTTYSSYTLTSPQTISSYSWVCGTAKDNAGNTGFSSPVEFKIDKTNPTVSIEGAPAGWQNSDAQASVSCSDTESGCDSATYRIITYSSDPGTCPTTYSDYTLSSPQTISSYSWVCGTAKDNAENTGFSSPVEFKIDKLDPSIDAFDVQPRITNSSVTITWRVSDTGGAHLSQVEVWRAPDLDGSHGDWGTSPISTHPAPADSDSWSSSATDSPPSGIWWYGLHVLDKAGNIVTETDSGLAPIKVERNDGPTADMACHIVDCNGPGCVCDETNWITFNGKNVNYLIENRSSDPEDNITQSTWSIIGWQDPFFTCPPGPILCDMTIPVPTIPAGDYTVKLEVLDVGGLIDNISHPITIKQDAISDFDCSLNPDEGWQNCSALMVSEDELVYFRDNSSHSDIGSTIISWTWTFIDGTPPNSSFQNASSTFTIVDGNSGTVTLDIQDDAGRTDITSHQLQLGIPLPEWREVAPF